MKIVYLFLFFLKHAIIYPRLIKALLEKYLSLSIDYYFVTPMCHTIGIKDIPTARD